MTTKAFNQYENTIEEVMNLKELSQEKLLVPINEGKWSVKEIIGHLYYWDKFILEKMAAIMEHGSKLPPFPDHDEYNKEAITYITKFTTVNELLVEFSLTRRALLKKMSSVAPDAKFIIGKGKRQFSTESFLKMFVKHDESHLKQIREFLKCVA